MNIARLWTLRARSLAPLVKARGFGMTSSWTGHTLPQEKWAADVTPVDSQPELIVKELEYLRDIVRHIAEGCQ